MRADAVPTAVSDEPETLTQSGPWFAAACPGNYLIARADGGG